MNALSGGRGKKAPYNTVVVRVPEPLLEKVETEIANYRQAILSGDLQPHHQEFNKGQIILEAKKILRKKKSAKQSLLNLLQVLYNDINELDLI